MDAPRGGFGHLRERYVGPLTMLLTRRIVVSILAVVVPTLGGLMFVFVGSLKQCMSGSSTVIDTRLLLTISALD